MMESKWLTPALPSSWDVGGQFKCVIQLNNTVSQGMLLAQLFSFNFFLFAHIMGKMLSIF